MCPVTSRRGRRNHIMAKAHIQHEGNNLVAARLVLRAGGGWYPAHRKLPSQQALGVAINVAVPKATGPPSTTPDNTAAVQSGVRRLWSQIGSLSNAAGAHKKLRHPACQVHNGPAMQPSPNPCCCERLLSSATLVAVTPRLASLRRDTIWATETRAQTLGLRRAFSGAQLGCSRLRPKSFPSPRGPAASSLGGRPAAQSRPRPPKGAATAPCTRVPTKSNHADQRRLRCKRHVRIRQPPDRHFFVRRPKADPRPTPTPAPPQASATRALVRSARGEGPRRQCVCRWLTPAVGRCGSAALPHERKGKVARPAPQKRGSGRLRPTLDESDRRV